ncbi:hypothetical protein AXF42_Ash014478 [Apostasia shenzhenica]|uniref:Uncharacterized protein n=1 Tax=Apostasia shenzhenica TaxID=1088818 RepID=A0A2H9ZWL6_9ASPA|nr:hypothetical protein AXF42_Ash014478 [Apostasia shenzhenica]
MASAGRFLLPHAALLLLLLVLLLRSSAAQPPSIILPTDFQPVPIQLAMHYLYLAVRDYNVQHRLVDAVALPDLIICAQKVDGPRTLIAVLAFVTQYGRPVLGRFIIERMDHRLRVFFLLPFHPV